jgi:hypothetical protein
VASGERIYSRGRGEVIGTGNGARRTMSLAAGSHKRLAVILTVTLVVLAGLWLTAPAQASAPDQPATPAEETSEANEPAASEGECDPATCGSDQGGSDSDTASSGGTPPPGDPPPPPDPVGSGEPSSGEPPAGTQPLPDEPAGSPPDAGAPPTEPSPPVEVTPVEPLPPDVVTPPEEVVPPVMEDPLPAPTVDGQPPIVVVAPQPSAPLDTLAIFFERLDSKGSGSLLGSTTEPFAPAPGRASGPATSGPAPESAGPPAVPEAAPRGLGPLSPIGPSSPSPAPGGATAVSPGGSGGGFTQIFLAALVAALTVGAAHRFTRRLIPLVAVWRPAAPVSPLERPG